MDQRSKRNLLIIKLGAFGDLCFALPAVSALKNAFPDAAIDWLVDSSFKDFLSLYQGLRHIIPVNSKELYEGSRFRRARAVLRIRKELGHYDDILILHRNLSFVSLAAGKGQIHQIVRQASPFGNLLAHQVEVPPLSLQESLAYRQLVAAATGLAENTLSWQMPALRTAPKHRPELPSAYVVVHVGGGENNKIRFSLKKWPGFPELLARWSEVSSLPPVLVGTQKDFEDSGVSSLPDGSINLCGKLTLADFPSLLGACRLFIGPDSGPLHLFDQSGVASLGLYGPTSEISWGLIGANSVALNHPVPCHPCYQDDGIFPPCPHQHICMRGLSVDQVARVVRERTTS